MPSNPYPPFTFVIQTQPNPSSPTITADLQVSLQEDTSGELYEFRISVPFQASGGLPNYTSMSAVAQTSAVAVCQAIWGAGSIQFVETGRYRWVKS